MDLTFLDLISTENPTRVPVNGQHKFGIATFQVELNHPAEAHKERIVQSAFLRIYQTEHNSEDNREKHPLNLTVFAIENPETGKSIKTKHIASFNINKSLQEKIDISNLLSLSVGEFNDSHSSFRIGLKIQSAPDISLITNKDKTSTKSVKKSLSNQHKPGALGPAVSNTHQKEPGASNKNNFAEFEVSLEVTSQVHDLTLTRHKRRASYRRRNYCSQKLCCLHRVYIKFSDIGWGDWVIAPKGYDAFYCKGGCPARYKTETTFSQIQSLLHQRHPGAIPAPSCVATKYKPLSLLYFDKEIGTMQRAYYDDMIVSQCRCT